MVILFVFASCQKGNCHRSQRNAILGKNQYNSKEYQNELYRLIKESPEVDYYFEMREQFFGQEYLVVSAYGDAFCGKLCLVIREEDAVRVTFDSLKGYQGSQLIGLSYIQTKTDYGSTLVFNSVEYIID